MPCPNVNGASSSKVLSEQDRSGYRHCGYKLTTVMPRVNRRKRKGRRSAPKTGGGLRFGSLVAAARAAMRKAKPLTVAAAARKALSAVNQVRRKARGKPVLRPRTLAVPKIGGAFALVPFLSALSAIGSLLGGASGIVRAVNDIRNNKNAKAPVKIGSGYLLHRKRNGSGFYLKPYQPKN